MDIAIWQTKVTKKKTKKFSGVLRRFVKKYSARLNKNEAAILAGRSHIMADMASATG
jgi:hypothetical protein